MDAVWGGRSAGTEDEACILRVDDCRRKVVFVGSGYGAGVSHFHQ